MIREIGDWVANLIRFDPRVNNLKEPLKDPNPRTESAIPPGRVSVSNDTRDIMSYLNGMTELITPSFRTDLIPLIRSLYKVNPDVGIAIQDMFKLGNTKHIIDFPYNTDKEAEAMRKHLKSVSKNWANYTAGIFGIVNKMMVQMLVGGAISIEAVPKNNLSGVSNITFVNPEDIIFKRNEQGVYEPYQINKRWDGANKERYIKLNLNTYLYLSMFNDTDEPYGIPPFLTALDSLKTQADMKTNIKHIMEMVGMMGFLETKMAKPDIRPDENITKYEARLNRMLKELKVNTLEGLKDGTVAGFIDDHEFKLNATTKDMGNIDKPWNLNQQSVANGLGVSGSLIGVSTDNKTEGGTSIMFSKMLSQLANLQEFSIYALEFIYSLELRLAGFNNKGINVKFFTSTVNDEVKIQQGKEYKIRNCGSLYERGIIGQHQFAHEMGYEKPDQDEPRVDLADLPNASEGAKKAKREKEKGTSDRGARDKGKPVPKRKDGSTKE